MCIKEGLGWARGHAGARPCCKARHTTCRHAARARRVHAPAPHTHSHMLAQTRLLGSPRARNRAWRCTLTASTTSPSLCTLGNRLLPLDRACSCCRGTAFACLCWACRGARGLRSWMNAREEHGNCVAQRETHAPLGAIEAAQSLRGRVAFICERKQSGANATRKRCSRESTARPEVHQMGC